ncbi:Carnitine O-acetyltransferase mitochondrial [Rhizoclosmatium sp. JEL0117]|nr:Carnitine O-acetyltransferase mitochondrial [Rhizoclosmatium sp. JEL0117]
MIRSLLLSQSVRQPTPLFKATARFSTATATRMPSSSNAPGPLYRSQSSLPKLPVPALSETLPLYLETVRPLVDDAAYAKTVAAVQEFQKPGGKGEELQARLIEHDKSKSTSWLIDWWNSYAYMGYRDPVVVWVNYFFCFVDKKQYLNKPAARAAELITGALAFKELVVSEQLEPDMARKAPLCSHQYRFLFNSTRIPKIPEDVTRNSDPRANNHIIVMRHNQFYVLELVENGRQLSTAEIEAQLQKIYKAAGNVKEPAVGAFTTQDRDSWAKIREQLIASPKNKASLDKIESASFVVCLDDTKPVSYEQRSHACWVGDGKNRFFDKSFQFIVFDNGVAGFNGEHSMMDATPTSRLCDWVLESLDKGKINHGTSNSTSLSTPQKLAWDLSPQIKQEITTAEQKFAELVGKHDLKVVVFEGYGKNLIKKLGCSPDAYAQMAIQLAYYKTYGVSRATYESAQTKKYAYGRTETGRSVSLESVAWVKAMQDASIPAQKKGELGREAIAAQSGYMAKAVDGKGVDRHLLGLRLLLKPNEPKPTIFTDPSYALSSHWNLSTSQISSEYYNGYGWGEVVADGYGCAYMVNNNVLQFNLVSQKLQNEEMRYNLLEALREMKVVFEATAPAPKAKL